MKKKHAKKSQPFQNKICQRPGSEKIILNILAMMTLEPLHQGNLSKGIDKKTVRREDIEPIKRVFTFVIFSVTHFLQGNKRVRNCIFYTYNFLQKLFSKWKP